MSSTIIVIIALIVSVFVIGWLVLYPIQRDRILFGKSPGRLIGFNLIIIANIILVLWAVAHLRDIDSTGLLQNNVEAEGIPRIWAIMAQLSDPGNLPLATGQGRYLALACALFGIVFLSGFLVSSIVNFLSKRSQKWQQGLIHYNHGFNKYVIIIGVNDQTSTLIKRSLKRDDVRYVLIQTRQDVEKMRMRLDLDLDKKEENRIVFYFAERTSWEDIETLHPEKAVEIYILGEDPDFENENDHDAFNIKCLENISSYLKDHGKGRTRCHVNFEYQSTFTAFKSTHIYRSLDKNVEFIPFNVHEIWAKKVLVDNFAIVPKGKKGEIAVQPYFPLDSNDGISVESDKTVHLIILGMNQMGTALATQTALIAHYPNFHRNRKLRTTITFIDNRGVVEGEYFRGRYASLFDLCRYREFRTDKNLSTEVLRVDNWIDPIKKGRYKHLQDGTNDPNFMDIQWEFIQANVASDEVRKYLGNAAMNPNTITTIAVCFNHSQQAIATALYMPEMVYKGAMQILVYQQNIFDLISKVETGEKVWKRYNKLRPFGMIERSYTESPFDNSNAKILYYLFYNGHIGRKRPGMEEYKYSPAPDISTFKGVKINARFEREVTGLWNQLGIVDKLSNIDMVDSIPTKLRSLGLATDTLEDFDEKLGTDDNLECLAKTEHTRWVTERLLMGFRPLDDNEREWQLFPKAENLSQDELKSRRRKKKEIAKKSRAHLDICSNTMLFRVDPDCRFNDMNVVSFIPQILRYAEWLNVMRMVEPSANSFFQRLFFTFKDKNAPECAIRLVEDNDTGLAIWVMDTAVTQRQWKKTLGNNPSKLYNNNDYLPVISVSREDVQNFILVLRKRTGLTFDLPTKAEWEMIAKLATPYIHWDEPDEKDSKISTLWHSKSEDVGPCQVRSLKDKQRNPFKIYDIIGNVWEWTKDKFDNAYYFLGGSWQHGPKYCVIVDKNSEPVPIDFQSEDIGFRLVWRFNLSDTTQEVRAEIKANIESLATIPTATVKKHIRNRWIGFVCSLRNKAQKIHKSNRKNRDSGISNTTFSLVATIGSCIRKALIWTLKLKVRPSEQQIKKLMRIDEDYDKEQIIQILNCFKPVEEGYFIRGTEKSDKIRPDHSSLLPKEWYCAEARDQETPHHFVKVGKFHMMSIPVTQKLWNLVMCKTSFENPSSSNIGDRYPQSNVSWNDTQAFMSALKIKIGIEFRLPTSAEWEYAAKGGQMSVLNQRIKSIFENESLSSVQEKWDAIYSLLQEVPGYYKFSGDDDKIALGLYPRAESFEVGQYSSNALGIYDLSGCVGEWCQDIGDDKFYLKCLNSEEYNKYGYVYNPICNETDDVKDRVWRGGGWTFDENASRCTYFFEGAERDISDDLGFRLVIDEEEYMKFQELLKQYSNGN